MRFCVVLWFAIAMEVRSRRAVLFYVYLQLNGSLSTEHFQRIGRNAVLATAILIAHFVAAQRHGLRPSSGIGGRRRRRRQRCRWRLCLRYGHRFGFGHDDDSRFYSVLFRREKQQNMRRCKTTVEEQWGQLFFFCAVHRAKASFLRADVGMRKCVENGEKACVFAKGSSSSCARASCRKL